MRPSSIIWFERLLIVALALDFAVNLASWPGLSARLAANGLPTSPALILLLCVLSPLVGAVFLYFVARRGSNLARWILTVLVALGAIGFVAILFTNAESRSSPLFGVTAAAELLKVAAVTRLFAADAGRWFRSRSGDG